jgi:glucokinase
LNDTDTRTRQAQSRPLVVAVALSGAEIKAGLVDERARLIAARQAETPQAGGRAAISAVTRLILEIAACAERGLRDIKAIGLSMPGIIEPRTGRVRAPTIKGWEHIELQTVIEKELTASGIDVRTPAAVRRARAGRTNSAHPLMVINSGSAAQVAAEAWTGAARGKRHVVFLKVGASIEAGILADGRILRGAGDMAGAVGWLALSESYQREYAKRGCLETEASSPALVRRTIEEWSSGADSLLNRLTEADATQLTASIIIRAARGGDPLALKVVTEICRWIGRAVAELISTLNPEVIVIGGGLGRALRLFMQDIRREARLWAQPLAARQCRILSAALGPSGELLGAARLAWLAVNPAG